MSEFAPNARWYVAEGETDLYKQTGAFDVVEAGGLIAARNKALEDAFAENRPCVQISDDLTKLELVYETQEGKIETTPITLNETVQTLANIAKQLDCRLAGVAPVANTFYYTPKKPIKTLHFIVGDMIYIEPSTPRFDDNLKLKEDYDFTAQHIDVYGGVARCDFIFASFKHRTNAGGAVAYRTPEIEQEAIAILKNKWGSAIKDNPRRPNEILFKGENILKTRA